MSAKTERLQSDIEEIIDGLLAPMFVPGTKFTVIARQPDLDTADCIVTSDTDAGVHAAVDRMFPLASPAPASLALEKEASCDHCNDTGVVDDGEINCFPDGTPFNHGPVKCVKDCPKCKTAAPGLKLSVWYGSMPETNGKSNFTAILHKGDITEGITIDRSEYPERVRYEADRLRYLIGEIDVEPFILDYDADKHSGYVAPAIGGEAKEVAPEGWRSTIAHTIQHFEHFNTILGVGCECETCGSCGKIATECNDSGCGHQCECDFCGGKSCISALESLLAAPVAQALPAEPTGMVLVTQEDGNNYCRILTLLGMEEEGDPVAEIERLLALPVAAEKDAK